MSVASYVRAHWLATLLCTLSAVASYGLVLLVTGSSQTALLVLLVQALFMGAAGLVNFLAHRMQTKRLEEIVGAAERDVVALASTLDGDGSQLVAVRKLATAAASQLGSMRAEQADYQDFIETWVHEVKTPLAAAGLMLENRADPSLRPLATALGQVDALVERALFYARSATVERDYLVRRVGLDQPVKEAVRSRASQLISAGVAIDLGGLGDPAPVVPCDPKWVVFILGQLIDNAVRYRVEDGSRTPQLTFAAQVLDAGRASERVDLEVHDNGCGISAADLPRVFDKGFTGANGRSRKRSTGIGLYLVRRLCDRMGLAVSLESEEGAGTTVTLSFPHVSQPYTDVSLQ